MTSFSVDISNTKLKENTLNFHIAGSAEYGLDKSIVNSIRRTLISEIPCVAFRVEEGTSKDLIMEVNNSSLHNEFLLHRLSMIPLYINPETYENQYLFYLNVKHESAHPFRFVTTDDIQIFPLKEDVEVSDSIDLDNYDMKKPLSKQEHKEIFRPFVFRGKEYPILITELKSTNTEDIYQELICYGRPSVSDGREHARWKCCSDAMYTFLPNEELFMKIANDKAGIKKIIDDDERDKFIESLRISEGERYFYRDIFNEPNQYTFTITSIHDSSNKDLFLKSLEIMQDKLELIKQHFINTTIGGDTSIIIEPHVNENNYHFKICGQNDTLGNVLQSHIVNKYTDKESLISFCGYKKSHPLEEYISLYLGLNPSSDIFGKSEEMKMNAIVKFMDEVIEDLLSIYKEIGKEALKSL
jgi:DNA-directed RNA polymerase subunit L